MNLDKTKIALLNSHSRNLNRRQFVGLGLATATSSVLLPTFGANLFTSPSALAHPNDKFVAYLGFDLAGGAALPGNFLVGGKGGPEDLLNSYNTLGWKPKTDGWDSRFGLPMAKANVSKIFDGLTQAMSPEAQKNFKMASLLTTSRDDTSDNPLSILELLASSKLHIGNTTSKPLGTVFSASGGNSRGVLSVPQFAPRTIKSYTDLKLIKSISNAIDGLTPTHLENFIRTLKRVSSRQAEQLLASNQIGILENSYQEISKLVGNHNALDPRTYGDIQNVYNISANSAETSNDVVRSGIVNCVLSRITGPAVITIGGCDYHDGSITSGDNKDLEIGREIGRAVELAHRRKVPLFIHVYTDGGCGASTDRRNWSSDNGEKSMVVIGLYDPTGENTFRSSKSIQIGDYTNGQGINRDTLIGASSSRASYAVFANYINACGKIGQLDQYTPRIFSSTELETILTFS
jgi:hypothetical protein